jgi:glycosyltransferase involved in cell wall biosynthesis
MLVSVPSIARYMRTARPDVLLASATPANLAALAVPSAVPVVACVNVPISQATALASRPLLARLVRLTYRRAAAIITVSRSLVADTVAASGVARERIHAIASPIPVDEIRTQSSAVLDHPWFAAGQPPVVLGVGKLKAQKDFATLLHAFAALRRTTAARLLILGEGEQRAALLALARRLGVAADVALPGFVPDPFPYMARAAVLALPSRWEGSSNVAAEALACGCPVVATDCPGGTAELLGECAALVPVGDADALAHALSDTLASPPDKRALVAHARAHSAEAAAARYLEILRLCARARGGEPVVESRPASAKKRLPRGTRRRGFNAASIVSRNPAAGATPAHIGVFIHSLSGGGAQRRTLTLVNGFASRGHRVSLVLVSRTGPLVADVSPSVEIRAVRWWKPNAVVARMPRRVQLILAIPSLARELRKVRPDVLLSAASHVHLPFLCAYLLARIESPVVLRMSNHLSHAADGHGGTRRKLAPRLANRFYRYADRIIAVSAGVARDVANVTGYPPERIHTIYSPIVTDELRRRARAPLDHPWFRAGEPPVVLAVGRIVRQKDFPTLIRAFARVRAARPARLVILGGAKKGRRLRTLQKLIAKLALTSDVRLEGYVSNPLPYMREAAVYVLSSAWEGLPGALIEALACGATIVSSDCPSGPREILEHGAYGSLVAVGDAEAMASSILDALAHPSDPEVQRERAERFSADASIDGYLDVLLDRSPWSTAAKDEPVRLVGT